MRSPTITVDFEWAPSMLSASRIMTGFGLPTKYGFTPVALWISAARAPHPGNRPFGVVPFASGFVATNLHPSSTRRMAVVISSKE